MSCSARPLPWSYFLMRSQLNATSVSEDTPKFGKRQIEKLLQKGGLVLFLDGYDEINFKDRAITGARTEHRGPSPRESVRADSPQTIRARFRLPGTSVFPRSWAHHFL